MTSHPSYRSGKCVFKFHSSLNTSSLKAYQCNFAYTLHTLWLLELGFSVPPTASLQAVETVKILKTCILRS